ncbi:MAG TPA: HTTM domain-containing protein [Herpetosiphonaceae bacterium]|nr:HTTM domain-containing protein [Herpetosiphonaceae bacterium]
MLTLTSSTDARPVAVVRIMLGLAAIIAALETYKVLVLALHSAIVALPFWTWFPRLSPMSALLLTLLWITAAILFAVGWRVRYSGVLLTLVMATALLSDQRAYSNHLYLLTLLIALLTLADSAALWSIDARRYGSRATVPGWPILLIKLQVSIVYLFAGLTKMHPAWLSGVVLAAYLPETTRDLLPLAWQSLIIQSLAWLSIGVELFLAVALWLPRLRWLALVVGIGLHAGMLVALEPESLFGALRLGNFGLITLTPYLLFFPWPQRQRLRTPSLVTDR